MIDCIHKNFPDLDARKLAAFESLGPVYGEWNSKINVISRKDIDNLYEHHVLHSLAIAKVMQIPPGASVLDVGTGGGFPGIPLAVMFPEAKFTLLDSIGKKLIVADAAAKAACLDNVKTVHRNVLEEKGKYNFVVSRAVMNGAKLLNMVAKNISSAHIGMQCNSLVMLKGGNLEAELEEIECLKKKDRRLNLCTIEIFRITDFFSDEFFNEKYVVKVQF